ncbi:MAG: reverse transcriptase domain-containing protein, partial [Acidobacteriota bacterium]|nr:reverse transcriptase domain-containing protein [Acidobacteriota bacterium]
LSPSIEKLLEDCSYAYRKGFSHAGAARAVERAYEDGFRYVLDADIESFFDAVDWPRLSAKLEALFPFEPLVRLIEECVRAPVRFEGTTVERTRGLPQGASVSPLLANLYLGEFDEELCRAEVNYGHEYEMFAWLNKYFVPTGLKPDYLLVSYYGDDHNDCGQIKMDAPKWETVFKKLHGLYPDAKLGFGEIGAECKRCEEARDCCKKDKSYYISTYYGTVDKRLKGTVENYVGGYFYWYFLQDMVPSTKPELAELIKAIKP